MAQTKREVKQLQQMLGLVPSDKEAKDVIFVCIDCEAFEFDQTKITEIGVSVLDSRALKDVDPGDRGEPWFELMKHMHLRPIEHANFVNQRFVKGCPDRFNFGENTFIKLKDAGRVLDRICCDPNRLHEARNFDIEIADTQPNIALVGHDLRNDTEYIKRLNFTPQHVEQRLDTQVLARSSKKQSPGLSKLLAVLSIKAHNLHNAGNDAAYTLQALIGLAVQDFHHSGSVTEALVAANAARTAERLAKKAKKADSTAPATVDAPRRSVEPLSEKDERADNRLTVQKIYAEPMVRDIYLPEKTRHERKDRFRRDRRSPGK